ncbi:MAG: hypothetical protein IPJ93_11995 [Bacteroidota bacterium]|nr:MAG: hypothetical protein IPJ93_11995 [Bacteroidota bacterium]
MVSDQAAGARLCVNRSSHATSESTVGNGDQSRGELQPLAPFEDVNGDGLYIPDSGDYPRYLLSGEYPAPSDPNKLPCDDYIFGDQTLWWVFNDIGNIKKETNSAAIGLEFRKTGICLQHRR